MIDDLAAFVAARLDEREALAGKIQQVLDSGWNYWDELGGLIGEIADPAAMLREVAAMRAVLDVADRMLLTSLAAIWPDHPGYDPAW